MAKYTKYLIFLIMLLKTTIAMAEPSSDMCGGYGRVSAGVNRTQAKCFEERLMGASINYTELFVFDFPITIQSGLDFSYTASHFIQRVDGTNVECANRLFTTSIPFNVGYTIGDLSVYMYPYVGLNFSFNNLAKKYENGKESINYIVDKGAKRFQPELNVGYDLNIMSFGVGYRFSMDLNDFITSENSIKWNHRIEIFHIFNGD